MVRRTILKLSVVFYFSRRLYRLLFSTQTGERINRRTDHLWNKTRLFIFPGESSSCCPSSSCHVAFWPGQAEEQADRQTITTTKLCCLPFQAAVRLRHAMLPSTRTDRRTVRQTIFTTKLFFPFPGDSSGCCPSSSCHVAFDPTGRFMHRWTWVVSLALVYNLWVIIFRSAFADINEDTKMRSERYQDRNPGHSDVKNDGWTDKLCNWRHQRRHQNEVSEKPKRHCVAKGL